MHPLRMSRTAWLLPLALLVGCSSTVGSRFAAKAPQSQSIAVSGDRPLPASTGEPGSKVVAEAEEPEPRVNPKRRIAGKVVDEAGDPVAGATVRLADGATKGGKEIVGTTDRTGGFTLNGLRAGSTYVLIAEGDDDRGPLRGRVEATTGQPDVEIALAPEEKKAARKSARPPKARPISNRDDVPADADGYPDDSPKVNREDLAPPAQEADALDPGPPPLKPVGRPQLAPPQPGVGWKNGKDATASRPNDSDVDGETATPDAPVRRRKKPSTSPPADPDDESNPLPPAVDPNDPAAIDEPAFTKPRSARPGGSSRVGANAGRKPRDPGELALAPVPKVDDQAGPAAAPMPAMVSLLPGPDPAPAAKDTAPAPPAEVAAVPLAPGDGPPTLPPLGAGPTAVVAAQDPPGPTASPPPGLSTPTQDVAPSQPAPQPAFALNPPTPKTAAPSPASPADYNPFALLPTVAFPPDRVVENPPLAASTPTPAPAPAPAAGPDPAPAQSPGQESSKKKWGELASAEKPAPTVAPAKVTLTGALLRRIRPAAEPKEPPVAACSYDARLLKLVDFRLPDLEGKPVRLQDFDADFILLDFWGTWCGPCLDAIPHLVALQKKYGPAKLRVVGIACEEVPPDQRKARVDEVARRLGINYPVLLSTMDGKPCPVQQALQIQAMPTMILVDRAGKVLWRNAGSTPESESRLDRILALNLSRVVAARR